MLVKVRHHMAVAVRRIGQWPWGGPLLEVPVHDDLIAVLNGQPAKVRLLGRGPAGGVAAYAALFVPEKVEEVTIADAPTSHRDGPHFLNVQRVLDIPEALGLLAPDVELTLIGKNANDEAFDKTAAIYKLAGAEDKFKRVPA